VPDLKRIRDAVWLGRYAPSEVREYDRLRREHIPEEAEEELVNYIRDLVDDCYGFATITKTVEDELFDLIPEWIQEEIHGFTTTLMLEYRWIVRETLYASREKRK
jgi:hypothetical protein